MLQVKRIQRVQNKVLWGKYRGHRTWLRDEKYQGRVTNVNLETRLWHGTGRGSITPEKLAMSVTGWDTSYSKVAAYGHGCYFAVSPLYPNNGYFSTTQNGYRQLLLADVLTGMHCCPVILHRSYD